MAANPDAEMWKVEGSRVAALGTIDTRVGNDCTSGDALVLFYPGCGDDIRHALFSSASRVTYYVLVDVKESLVNDLEAAMPKSAKAEKLSPQQAAARAHKIGVQTVAAAAWTFQFRGKERVLLFFRRGSALFVDDNANFRFDIFFEKDFWDTSDTNPLYMILPRLNVAGMYVSNSAKASLIPFFPLLCLEQSCCVDMNGKMFVWQKVKQALNADIERVEALVEAARKRAYQLLYVEYDLSDLDRDLRLKPEEWDKVYAVALDHVCSFFSTHAALPEPKLWEASKATLMKLMSDAITEERMASALAIAQSAQLDRNFLESLNERLKFQGRYFKENALRVLALLKQRDRSGHTQLQGIVGTFLRMGAPMPFADNAGAAGRELVQFMDANRIPDIFDWDKAAALLEAVIRNVD